MKVSEMPDGLLDYSWAGTLPKRMYGAYPTQTVSLIVGSLLTALVIAAGIWLFTQNTTHLYAALPIASWLIVLGMPVLYSTLVRDVRIVTPQIDGKPDLDLNHWWKKDAALLDEKQARYENGRRVFWLIKPISDDDPEIRYLRPEDASVIADDGSEIVDSAEVFGLAGYVVSGSSYVFQKARTFREVIQLGAMAAVIAVELIFVFMLTGRLTEDVGTIDQARQPAELQADSVRR